MHSPLIVNVECVIRNIHVTQEMRPKAPRTSLEARALDNEATFC